MNRAAITGARAAVAAIVAAAVSACGGGSAVPAAGGTVRIEAERPGGVEENEQAVLLPLERAVVGLEGVVDVRGVATAGGVTVDIRFARGVERGAAQAAVAGAIQGSLAILPAGMSSPMITAGRPTEWIYALVKDGSGDRLRAAILSAPGVVRADVCGERLPAAEVTLDADRLLARGVVVADVARALATANLDVPAGRVQVGGSSIGLRAHGALSSLADLASVIVDDRGTRLEDVADVRLARRAACLVAGTDDVIVRVGLRGRGAELEDARREVLRRLHVAGARPIEPPLTFGVAETARPADDRERAVAAWADRIDGGYALAPVAGTRIFLLAPGRHPDARATAVSLTAPSPEPGLLARWALRASPLVEATVIGDEVDALVRQGLDAVAAAPGAGAIVAAGCESCRRSSTTRMELDRARMATLGVSVADVAEVMRLLRPQPISSLVDGTSIVDVTLQVGGDVDRALDLPVRSAGGTLVRLADVVAIRVEDGPAEIRHVGGRRAVTVWAQGRPGASSSAVKAALARALPGATFAPVDLRALEAASWRSP